MSNRIPLGESRREAISRVQERLGPATSRPLAEQTFWALAQKKKITMNDDGMYLIEAGIDDTALRAEATDQMQQQQKIERRPRRGMLRFNVNHQNTTNARVGTTWKSSSMHSMYAPTFNDAECQIQEDQKPNDPNAE